MNILIVEDDRVISLLLTKLVEKLGYTVVDKVTKGESAITITKKEPVDLIFMDVMLEGVIDGISTMEVIQSQKDIPAIYITGNSDAMTIKRAHNTRYLDYLIKPVDHNRLKTLCENYEKKLNE